MTPGRAHQLSEWILKDPLRAGIGSIGLLPCSRFDGLPTILNASSKEITPIIARINSEELLELFKYLLKEIKHYPKDYETFRKQNLENKRLYRVTSTVFCFLIMLKVTLEEFDRGWVEKDIKYSLLQKINHLLEKDIDLVPFLKLFSLVLYHFQFIRFFPAMVALSDDVDKPEPYFCHWISKVALMILYIPSLKPIFLKISNSARAIFIEKLKESEKGIFSLFVNTCKEISVMCEEVPDKNQSLYPDPDACIVFKPKILKESQVNPIIEPAMKCSELEKLLEEEAEIDFSKPKRRKKRKPTSKRAPIPTIQSTPLDEEPEDSPNPTASSSPHENNHWDGPLLDLDQTWRTEGSRKLVGMTDNKEKLKVLKRSHSAPPITKTTRESF